MKIVKFGAVWVARDGESWEGFMNRVQRMGREMQKMRFEYNSREV